MEDKNLRYFLSTCEIKQTFVCHTNTTNYFSFRRVVSWRRFTVFHVFVNGISHIRKAKAEKGA